MDIVYICVSRGELAPNRVWDQLPSTKFTILRSPTSAANRCCIDFLHQRGTDVRRMKTVRLLRPSRTELQSHFVDRMFEVDRLIHAARRKRTLLMVIGHHREISTLYAYHRLQGLAVMSNLDEIKLTRRYRQTHSPRVVAMPSPRITDLRRSPKLHQLPIVNTPFLDMLDTTLLTHHITALNTSYLQRHF